MSESRRIACLLVPDLILCAELRARPDLAGCAFAVASGAEGRAQVVSVSPEAARAGCRARQTLAHARTACSELIVRIASPALERSARASLLDVALSLTPRAVLAERAAPPFSSEAAVFLDATGVDSLFRSEAGFATALGARAESLGLPGVVAITGSRFAAHVAARQLAHGGELLPRHADSGAFRVLPPGSEAAFLAALPIDLLAADDALAQRLTRFGIRRVRDLLALPRRALAQRLGPEARLLAARARGEETEAPLPEPAATRSEESVDLEFPVDRAEPLLFVLRGLLSRLFERLAVRSLAARDVHLELVLAGGGRDARRIGVAAATRDLRVWLRLLALELETHPPHTAIEAVTMGTEGCPERRDQLDLFLPHGPSPGALDRALAELEALCGSEHVGAPRVADTHRPDAFALGPFRPTAEPPRSGSGDVAAARPDSAAAMRVNEAGSMPPAGEGDAQARARGLAVRALRPPVPAQVRVEAGSPVSIRSAVAMGHIVHASGPWRATGRWWSEEDRYALDHFDVQVSDGVVARLCFDWIERCWCVDALYD